MYVIMVACVSKLIPEARGQLVPVKYFPPLSPINNVSPTLIFEMDGATRTIHHWTSCIKRSCTFTRVVLLVGLENR